MKDLYLKNLTNYAGLYFAQTRKDGEYGKEGLTHGLYGAMHGLEHGIGLEGILESLKAQGLASIHGNNGLNAKMELSDLISGGSKTFMDSAAMLKTKDLASYITGNLGEGVKLIQEKAYEGKTLAELMQSKSEGEQLYAKYLFGQMNHAVEKNMYALAIEAQANDNSKGYEAMKAQLEAKTKEKGEKPKKK